MLSSGRRLSPRFTAAGGEAKCHQGQDVPSAAFARQPRDEHQSPLHASSQGAGLDSTCLEREVKLFSSLYSLTHVYLLSGAQRKGRGQQRSISMDLEKGLLLAAPSARGLDCKRWKAPAERWFGFRAAVVILVAAAREQHANLSLYFINDSS